LLDEDRYSYWATDDDVHQAELEISINSDEYFDLIRLRENIKLGQRIDSIKIENWSDQRWQHLAQATSIGGNRLVKLENHIQAKKLKITVYAPVAIKIGRAH